MLCLRACLLSRCKLALKLCDDTVAAGALPGTSQVANKDGETPLSIAGENAAALKSAAAQRGGGGGMEVD